MANLNLVIVAGSLTRDPAVKFLTNEKAVANFGLAINRKFKGSDGEMKEDVVFIDVEAWGRTAELVGQFLVKGSQALIEGRLRMDSWDDKTTGQKRSKIVVVAENVQFIGARQGGGTAAVPAPGTNTAPGRNARPAPADDDSAPF